MIRKFIKKIIPSFLVGLYKKEKIRFNLILNHFYDFRRFMSLSSALQETSKQGLQSSLTKEYHAIEKGLSLPVTRPGFGENRINKIIKGLRIYISSYGKDEFTDTVINTLQEYICFHNSINMELSFIDKVNNFVKVYGKTATGASGGIKKIKRESTLSKLNFDFGEFVRSRHSIRDFVEDPVDVNLVLKAVHEARFTPSVCNRQPWKVFIVNNDNQELKHKLLDLQNGNRGFRDYIDTLIVVTGKMSHFFENERNQVFIDGGMFAMNLLLALHAKGLGTCCLNNAFNAKTSKKFSKLKEFDSDCIPIMYIAVGNLKSEFNVAVSQRKPIQEVATVC